MSGVTEFLDGRVRLFAGDCREGVAGLADNSIDAIVTDPPYALDSIRKRFGGDNAARAKPGRDGAFQRASSGFMGQKWDTGEVAFDPAFWVECLRVLKPGGHVLAFSGTRTYHRLATAIEDAGFEIRDMTAWLYGTGFPKNYDVAKGIDKKLGAPGTTVPTGAEQNKTGWAKNDGREYQPGEYQPGSPEGAEWQGWGTALKPALEPVCLARKPLDGTIAENVLKWGVGGLNIENCRVGETGARNNGRNVDSHIYGKLGAVSAVDYGKGRYPANVIHDGSGEVEAAFPNSPGAQGAVTGDEPSDVTNGIYGKFGGRVPSAVRGDTGSAARFFYSAKADGDDRIGSAHPTVKPVDLMRYLVRLVTPPGGLVLDPFAGTGTTGEAAFREGFSAYLCEREGAYQDDIAARMALANAGPQTRKREIIKRRIAKKTLDAAPLGGLFGEGDPCVS